MVKVLFCRSVKDGEDLNDKTGHDDHRPQGEAQEPEAVLFLVQRHDREARDEGYDADDHPLIILFAEGKSIHNFYIIQYNSSKDIFRYFRMEKNVLNTATRTPVRSIVPNKMANCFWSCSTSRSATSFCA